MKWEDYIKNIEYINEGGWTLTDIECPECGKNIFMNMKITLSVWPPKNRYKCMFCGWEGEA